MITFKSAYSDDDDCFIDINEIVAIAPFWFNGGETKGSLIFLRGGGEIKVLNTPEDVKEKSE